MLRSQNPCAYRGRALPTKCGRSISGECLASKRSAQCHADANEAAEIFFRTARIQRATPLLDCSLASLTAFQRILSPFPTRFPRLVFGEQRRFTTAGSDCFYWSERRG